MFSSIDLGLSSWVYNLHSDTGPHVWKFYFNKINLFTFIKLNKLDHIYFNHLKLPSWNSEYIFNKGYEFLFWIPYCHPTI